MLCHSEMDLSILSMAASVTSTLFAVVPVPAVSKEAF